MNGLRFLAAARLCPCVSARPAAVAVAAAVRGSQLRYIFADLLPDLELHMHEHPLRLRCLTELSLGHVSQISICPTRKLDHLRILSSSHVGWQFACDWPGFHLQQLPVLPSDGSLTKVRELEDEREARTRPDGEGEREVELMRAAPAPRRGLLYQWPSIPHTAHSMILLCVCAASI